MKILCYGDSNTYGYDPRDGGRYAAKFRWVDLLGQSGYETVNEGLNGREIPTCEAEYMHLEFILSKNPDSDIVILALGVNDAYNMKKPGGRAISDRWREVFSKVSTLKAWAISEQKKRIILVAPPFADTHCWGEDRADIIKEALEEISEEYALLAGELGMEFVDANTWGIEIAGDGVHFTEAGSTTFFEKMKAYIEGDRG